MITFKIYSIQLHYLLVISAVWVVTRAASLPQDTEAIITHYENTNDGKGNYHFRYDTSNGIIREETGTLVDVGLPNERIQVKGSYSYIRPDAVTVTFTYTADENGYIVSEFSPTGVNARFGDINRNIPPQVLSALLGR